MMAYRFVVDNVFPTRAPPPLESDAENSQGSEVYAQSEPEFPATQLDGPATQVEERWEATQFEDTPAVAREKRAREEEDAATKKKNKPRMSFASPFEEALFRGKSDGNGKLFFLKATPVEKEPVERRGLEKATGTSSMADEDEGATQVERPRGRRHLPEPSVFDMDDLFADVADSPGVQEPTIFLSGAIDVDALRYVLSFPKGTLDFGVPRDDDWPADGLALPLAPLKRKAGRSRGRRTQESTMSTASASPPATSASSSPVSGSSGSSFDDDSGPMATTRRRKTPTREAAAGVLRPREPARETPAKRCSKGPTRARSTAARRPSARKHRERRGSSRRTRARMPASARTARSGSAAMRIAFSGFDGNSAKVDALEAFAEAFDGVVVDEVADATHLVVAADTRRVASRRSFKFLVAVAARLWVLPFEWVEASLEQHELAKLEDFEVLGCDSEQRTREIPEGAPGRARRAGQRGDAALFGDCVVLLDPALKNVGKGLDYEKCRRLLKAGGARIVDVNRRAFLKLPASTEATASQRFLLISTTRAAKRRHAGGVYEVNKDWLTDACAAYDLDLPRGELAM